MLILLNSTILWNRIPRRIEEYGLLLFFERKVANLIYAYPDGPQDMDKATIISVSDMITVTDDDGTEHEGFVKIF